MAFFDLFNPMAALQAKAMPAGMPGAGEMPIPTPRPDPQQAAPPSAPAAAPAPSPSQSAGPAPGGGGVGSVFSGLGGKLSAALNGDGFFATEDPSNSEIDPMTGIPKGLSRRMQNQSMMKMGLMLMAAGVRQSDDSRARILGGLGGALDNSDQVNSFARNRLEMAKVKLLEREATQKQASVSMLNGIYGVGGGTVGTSPEGTPTAQPGATPGAMFPPAPSPQRDTSSMAPAGPVVTPEPGVIPPPMATPAPGAVDPITGGLPATAPGAGQPPLVDTGMVGTGDTMDGPKTGPIMAPAFDVSALPDKAPGPPKLAPYTPTPADRAIVQTMIAGGDAEGAIKFHADKIKDHENDTVQTAPYYDKGTGSIMVDEYKGGNLVSRKKMGDAPTQVTDQIGAAGEITREKRDPSGRVIDRDTVRDPIRDDATKKVIDDVSTERKALMGIGAEQAGVVTKKTAQTSLKTYQRFGKLIDQTRNGETFTGVGADLKRSFANITASLGMADVDTISKLENSADRESALGQVAGEFAKNNFGPQISDNDVRVARELMGAMATNQPEVIAAALERARMQARSNVENFNGSVADFNDRISANPNIDKGYYSVKGVDYDFDADDAERAAAAARPATAPGRVATPGTAAGAAAAREAQPAAPTGPLKAPSREYLEGARAAVAKKGRDAVIKRMIEMGYDTSGL